MQDFPSLMAGIVRSKLAARAQTIVRRLVRTALGLGPDDELCYDVEGRRLILTEMPPAGVAGDPFRTFREWSSGADRRAYKGL